MHSPLSDSFPPSFFARYLCRNSVRRSAAKQCAIQTPFPECTLRVWQRGAIRGTNEGASKAHVCAQCARSSHEFSAGEGPGRRRKEKGEPRLQQVLAGGGGGGERVRSPGRKKIPSSTVSSTPSSRFGAPLPSLLPFGMTHLAMLPPQAKPSMPVPPPWRDASMVERRNLCPFPTREKDWMGRRREEVEEDAIAEIISGANLKPLRRFNGR